MYVKLFGSILDSSIWSAAPATRLLWITMLAMADEFGIVYASVDGLAHRARITESECVDALAILEGPDKHTRDGTAGERIKRLTGGWELLNYQHYRELRTREQVAASVRQKRHRAKSVQRGKRQSSRASVTRHNVTTEAEAEAKAVAESSSSHTPDLSAHFPNDDHQQAYLAVRAASSLPAKFDAVLRTIHQPPTGGQGFDWPTIGQAVLEVHASGGKLTAQGVRAFCRKLLEVPPNGRRGGATGDGIDWTQHIAEDGE